MSVSELRHLLRRAYAHDPDLRETPRSAFAAVRDYFAAVDPGTLNGASRVTFVWAFTIFREPDRHRSTPTRQYLEVFFRAVGDQMVAAGSIAPGYNSHYFRLSRPSPNDDWHVDGSYVP